MKPIISRTIEDFIGQKGYVEVEATVFLGFDEDTPFKVQKRILSAMKVPQEHHERYIHSLTPKFRSEVERRINAASGENGKEAAMIDTYFEALPGPYLIKPAVIRKNILIPEGARGNTLDLKIRDIEKGGWIRGVPFRVDKHLVPAGDAQYHITTMLNLMEEHIRLVHNAYLVSLDQFRLADLIRRGKAMSDDIQDKEAYDGQFRKVMDAAHAIKSRQRSYIGNGDLVVSVKLREHEADVQINAELQGYLPSECILPFFKAAGIGYVSGRKKKIRTAFALPIGKVEMVQVPLYDQEGKIIATRHVLEREREVPYHAAKENVKGILQDIQDIVPWNGKAAQSIRKGGLFEPYGHLSLQKKVLETWK